MKSKDLNRYGAKAEIKIKCWTYSHGIIIWNNILLNG